MGRSGLITIIVETPQEEYSGDLADLISVAASEEKEALDVLSDKEWFMEEWNIAGEQMLWNKDDRPGHGKQFEAKGYLWAERDYWGEWDGGFEIEELREYNANPKLKQKAMLPKSWRLTK